MSIIYRTPEGFVEIEDKSPLAWGIFDGNYKDGDLAICIDNSGPDCKLKLNQVYKVYNSTYPSLLSIYGYSNLVKVERFKPFISQPDSINNPEVLPVNKRFDLKAALEGKGVIDVEFGEMRILCNDRPHHSHPIVAMTKAGGDVYYYTLEGVRSGGLHLYMAHIKKFLNLYKGGPGEYHDTDEGAKKRITSYHREYIKTIEVEL